MEDYKLSHTAPSLEDAEDGTAAPIHALYSVMPDVYTRPDLYTHGPAWKVAARIAQSVEGKPDAMVTIYRAAPASIAAIHTGDWVTTSLEYARLHACLDDDPAHDWPVLVASVPAKTLYNEGDLCEYGYNGPTLTDCKTEGN